MREIKVNRTKKNLEPTPEQIRKNKDFSRLSHEYERLTKRPRKPLYKDPKLFLLVFIILLVVFLLIMESNKEKQSESTEDSAIESTK